MKSLLHDPAYRILAGTPGRWSFNKAGEAWATPWGALGNAAESNVYYVSECGLILAHMDFTAPMRYFARMQAVSVLHLWAEPPANVVLDYLMTGDKATRAAAHAAARSLGRLSRAAARAVAPDAARAAAHAVAHDAARAAVHAAARAAAHTVAHDAARAVAYAVAYAAAHAAAYDVASSEFNDLTYECFEGVWDGHRG